MSYHPRLAAPTPDRKALLGDGLGGGLGNVRVPSSDDVYVRLLPGGTRVSRALLPRRLTETIPLSGNDAKLTAIPIGTVVLVYWTNDASPNKLAVLLDSLAPYV